MRWSYAYDPHIWPALLTVALTVFLGVYSWQRRRVPGAGPFAIGSLFAALWAFGAVFEIAAVDISTQVFWIKFQVALQLPTATALACFILEYAGLGRWLSRRNLIFLSVPPLLVMGMIITNDYYHLMWTGFRAAQNISPIPGVGNRVLVGYAYLLTLANFIVLLWLAFPSPQHRWPVAIMLLGQIIGRGAYLLDYIYAGLLGPGESILFVLGILSSTYALALFRFHVFEPVTAARTAVLEQMREGMLVLDLQGKIVDLNPAAARILGNSVAKLQGQAIAGILPAGLNLSGPADKTTSTPSEISLGSGKATRYYSMNLTPLINKRKQILGKLLLLREITGEKKAQEQIIEQQQVVATLQERERLARELHDSAGQVLGYVSLQAQTIQKWLQSGNNEKTESLLIRLAEVAKEGHADVRESILSLKAGSTQEWAFLPILRRYLADFQANYGIYTDLVLHQDFKDNIFTPVAEVQLLRVIQEALTNARKHSGARTVRVIIKQVEDRGYITVSDDGSGFDSDKLKQRTGMHFGLAFMRERMAKIGGSVDIDSQPGAGTVIKLEAPIRE